MALAPRRCADATVCAALKFATVRPMAAAAKALTARRMSGALRAGDPPAAIRPLRSQPIKPPRNPAPAARGLRPPITVNDPKDCSLAPRPCGRCGKGSLKVDAWLTDEGQV